MAHYRGRYSDGRSAAVHDVSVLLGPTALTITDTNSGTVSWRYEELRMVEEVYAGQPVRLRSIAARDARLTVDEAAFLDDLGRRSRRFGRYNLRRQRPVRAAIAWSAATVAVLVGLYLAVPLAARPIAALMPVAWEESLGRAVRDQFVTLVAGENARDCAAPAGRQALDRLVARLAAETDGRYRYRVSVIDDAMVNAFATPGGHIVIFRGLIDRAQTPEEVAGILAHEMGHVIERHGTEALVRSIGWSLLLTVAIGDASGLGSVALGVGQEMLTKSYGRAAERDADRVGVELLNRADIRGTGFVAFFQRMAAAEGDTTRGVRGYFSTHPPSADRAAAIRAGIAGTGTAMSPAEWRDLRAICRR